MPGEQQQQTIPGVLQALPVVGQIASAIAQGVQNRAQRKWNEKMYGRQREDALADWARTNQYNSPLAQMQRFKEAGLNPHLIYGGGPNNVSAPIRGTDAKAWNPQAPAFNFGQIVDQYLQTKVAGENIELMRSNKARVDADTAGKEIDNLKNAKGLPFIEGQLAANLEGKLIDNRYKSALTTLTLNRDEREAVRNTQGIAESIQRLTNMKQQVLESESRIESNEVNRQKTRQEIENLKETLKILETSGKIKEFELTLTELGLNPRTATYQERLLARAIHNPLEGVRDLENFIKLGKQAAKEGGKAIAELIKQFFTGGW